MPIEHARPLDRCEALCALINKAKKDRRVSNLEFRLLPIFLGEDGPAPSRAQIAEWVGCAPSSVPRAARKLESLGYLTRDLRDDIGGGKPTGYRIPEDTGHILQDTPRISEDTPGIPQDTPTTSSPVSAQEHTASSPVSEDTPPYPPPPKNIIKPPVEILPETTELGGKGGAGGEPALFDAPQAAPSPKPNRKKPEVAMRPDWRPSAEAMAYAADKGLVNGWCEATIENFRDYWISRGEKRADWDATWRANVRNEIQFKRNMPRGASMPSGARKFRNGVRPNPYIESVPS